jgi:hypothetical protein
MTTTNHSAAPAAVSVAVSAGLLLPQDRIARTPLARWAETLSRRLERCRDAVFSPRQFSLEVAGISNNAALVAALHGDREQAWSLCEQQIEWQHRYSRYAGDSTIAAHGVQPFVNLGRIEALAGDWEEALARFARLDGYRTDGAVDLGRVCVDGTGWQAVTGSREAFDRLLENMYVIDSLKALLQNRRFEEALAFTARLRPEMRPGLLLFAREAEVVSWSRLGRHPRARDLAAAAVRETHAWERAVFTLRLGETLAASGDLDAAADVLRPLAKVSVNLSSGRRSDLQTLYVLVRLAGACAEVGMADVAAPVAQAAYEGACAAGDEVFQIECLRLLSAAAHLPERDSWCEALEQLEYGTRYERYRRGSAAASPSPEIERLYAGLGEFLAN